MIKLFNPDTNIIAFAINNQTYTEDNLGFIYVNDTDVKPALASGFEYPRANTLILNTPVNSGSTTPINRTSNGRAIPNLYPFYEYLLNENVSPTNTGINAATPNQCFFSFDIIAKTVPLNIIATGFSCTTSFGGKSSLSLNSPVFFTDFNDNGNGTTTFTFNFSLATSKAAFDNTEGFLLTAIIYVHSLAFFD